MLRKFCLALAATFLLLGIPAGAQAQTEPAEVPVATESTIVEVPTYSPPIYFRGQVTEIVEERAIPGDNQTFYVQRVQVQRADNQETIELAVGSEFQPLAEKQRLLKGAQVILAEQETSAGTEFVLVDMYRLPFLAWLLVGFLIIVVMVARWQGLFSIVGMVVSLAVLSGFIVPQILSGTQPMLISIAGATIIATLTVYLSHGWHWESHVALGAMSVTLGLVAVLSSLAVSVAHLVGLGSEEAYFLQFGPTANINLQGLLLGGIVLGALGILDDICVSQIATVRQLFEVDPDMSWEELYGRSLQVGKGHVASLVNTLVLAYAGANLPLFLLFSINEFVPSWVTLNNEIIAEEVVRTLIGSIGLVLAVPIATGTAVFVVTRLARPKKRSGGHGHHHH